MIFRNGIILAVVCFILTACQQDYTYSYLMLHPHVLKRILATCQEQEAQSNKPTEQCEIALYAAAQFTSILDQQQADPEQFGQDLMTKQATYQRNLDALHSAQQAYAKLVQDNAPAEKLQAEQKNIEKLKTLVGDQEEEIAIIQAVIGVNSPE